MRTREINVILIAMAIIFFVTILTAFVVQTTLTDNLFGLNARLLGTPAAQLVPTPPAAIQPLSDPDSTNLLPLRSAALGFSLDYPAGWRKRETTLYAIISPSGDGLEPSALADSALWVGIPADEGLAAESLLNELVTAFGPQAVSRETLSVGGARWEGARVAFESPALGGQATALVAINEQNQVPYFLVAVASDEQWPLIEPVFSQIMGSFQFTQQAVLRPTDATPPPTPTATPTPVVYVVQSGDTLGGIALRYGVDMEALANRNGIEDPRRLRTGQQLIIPLRR